MAYQNACYAAMDAMDDNELQQYMAKRYGAGGAKAYQAGDDGEVEGEKDEVDAEAGTYNQSPGDAPDISAEGEKSLNVGGGPEPKKTEHTVTTYAKGARGDQALKYQLDEMKTRLARMEKERDAERVKAVDAERMNRLLHFHQQGYLPNPANAFEKLCYSKVRDDEMFEAMLEMIVEHSPKIPVGRQVPNFPGAERHLYERARAELDQTKKEPEQYAKQALAAVNKRANAEVARGQWPDTTGWYEEELAKIRSASKNGAAA